VRYSFIEAKKAVFGIARLCRALNVSRSGYYDWCSRLESQHEVEDTRLKLLVHEAYERGRRFYGSPRIHRALRKQGIRISRKRVIRLMQEDGLFGRARRRFKCTTDSEHENPVAPHVLARDFRATAPNQRWVSDTTELLFPNGKLFLAAVIDLYSRFVVGWAVSAVND
jgi:putative transposase